MGTIIGKKTIMTMITNKKMKMKKITRYWHLPKRTSSCLMTPCRLMILRTMSLWKVRKKISVPLLKTENDKPKSSSVSKVSKPNVNSPNPTLIAASNANPNPDNKSNAWRFSLTTAMNNLRNVMRKSRTHVTLRRSFRQNQKLKTKRTVSPKVYIVAWWPKCFIIAL